MAKKALGALKPIETEADTEKESSEIKRGTVQTVRMDRETFKVLRDAAFERGISQQNIMLAAIRRDLGLE